jgi:hypothetical protein
MCGKYKLLTYLSGATLPLIGVGTFEPSTTRNSLLLKST